MKVNAIYSPYHAEFLKWNKPSNIFGTVHYHFRDIKMKRLFLLTRLTSINIEYDDNDYVSTNQRN